MSTFQKIALALFLGACLLLAVYAVSYTIYHRNQILAQIEWIEYTVQPGDTLWRIARTYCPPTIQLNYWLHEIREANGISNPGGLQIGQVIQVPVVGR